VLIHGLQDICYAEQQIVNRCVFEKATNRDLVTGRTKPVPRMQPGCNELTAMPRSSSWIEKKKPARPARAGVREGSALIFGTKSSHELSHNGHAS
jgi:hypothetical protein